MSEATKVRLSSAQRSFLLLATLDPTGNPWPYLSVRDRAGGAKARMARHLVQLGLMESHNRINDAGRKAIAEDFRKHQEWLAASVQS